MIDLKTLIKNIQFVFLFSWDDFKQKYAGSVIGTLWAYIQPLITIITYWFVFQIVFHNESILGVPFILWLISGLLPWLYFGDTISNSISTLREYSYLIKKVKFNVYILPLIKPISTLMIQIVLIFITMIIFGLYGITPSLKWLVLLYFLLYLFTISVALSYLVSTLYAFFKDVSQLVSVLLQLVFWATPIVWDIKLLEGTFLLKIIKLTPLYYVVSGYRNVLIGKKVLEGIGEAGMHIYYWCIALIMLLLGVTVFKRSKKHFADII